MATKLAPPSPTERFLMPDGSVNPVWYRFLLDIARKLNAAGL